jgi:DNA-binding MarR family transcriptional regulator
MQSLPTQTSSPALTALARLVAAHATVTRELSAELVEQHGLSLAEYEVLLLLSRSEDRRMRRVDLAAQIRLSPSGVTRMLDRLERAGLVEKGACSEDARVTYAVLTDTGMAKLVECSRDHVAAAERVLGERLDTDKQKALADLLGRLGESDGADCEPGT